MKLKEAMEAVEEGRMIRHSSFKPNMLIKNFSIKNGKAPALCYLINKKYTYNPSIFMSGFWCVEDEKSQLHFLDALEHLILGKRAWLNEWKEDQFIAMDGMEIHYYYYEKVDFIIAVEHLISDEWEIIS